MADGQNAPETERVETVWDQNRARGDESSPAGTSGWRGGIGGGEWTTFATIAAVALAIGIVNALSGAQDAAWRGDSSNVGQRLFWELSSISVILLLVPILALAVRRMRETKVLVARIGIAAAALLGFSA